MAEQEARELRAEVEGLRARIASLEEQLAAIRDTTSSRNGGEASPPVPLADSSGSETEHFAWEGVRHSLSKQQIERYSRHILLDSFGVQDPSFPQQLQPVAASIDNAAQDRLCNASVLIVGAGGLGCPAAMYLAAAGVGKLGIVDKDHVDTSNLHRQVLHREQDIGRHKADSAADACKKINSTIKVSTHCGGFLPSNALELVGQYDVVIDASDNVPTRYLVSDACCVASKPLVSGAAIGSDGQLTVYCYAEEPPVPETCSRCSEAGVLGPVPGAIGVLQALEAIKILTGRGSIMSQRMLVADFWSSRFLNIKLRPKQPDCRACGLEPSITVETLADFDYAEFTGQPFHDKGQDELDILPADQRISPKQFRTALEEGQCVLDVRPTGQYNVAHIPGSVHVPFDEHQPQTFTTGFKKAIAEYDLLRSAPIVAVCRKGNDSQRAAEIVRDQYGLKVVDLRGGFEQLHRTAGTGFPLL